MSVQTRMCTDSIKAIHKKRAYIHLPIFFTYNKTNLVTKELLRWKAFESVVQSFPGKHKAANYKEMVMVNKMCKSYIKTRALKISINICTFNIQIDTKKMQGLKKYI